MILMNDFKAEPSELREATFDAVRRVIDSGWYVLGDEVKTFEKEWATVCAVPYAIGVGNGMDAIEIALRACGVGSGDEVITTPMTAFATILAILRAGAIPVLADIESDTALLSLESVSRCISARTKAVVLVHLYGQVRDMDVWQSFCDRYNITLIEDCAQAHLATWREKMVGSFGNAGAYSFYPTKNLGALGDAGMIVFQDKLLAECASRLRNYGQSVRYQHPEIGLNSRLDEIQAAILFERLQWLPEFTKRRRQIAKEYAAGIRNELIQIMSSPQEPSAHVYHLFVIICEQRDALQAYLKQHQIQSFIHYPVPVHRQKPCLDILRDQNGLKNSERHAAISLSLPCHPQMSDDDIAKVIQVLNDFSGEN